MIEHGSLMNILYGNAKSSLPYIGQGATEILWTDRHAYEVIAIKDERHIIVRRMNAKLTSSYYDQEYELTSDPNGKCVNLFRKKNGQWVERIGREYGSKFVLGAMNEYEDPSF